MALRARSRTAPRVLALLIAALAGPAAPRVAGAQPAAPVSDREQAEAHFERARRHIAAARCDLALGELRQSLDFEPTSVGARLNLGDCLVTLGRLPEAFRAYAEAETNAIARNDPRAAGARLATAQLEAKLVRVMLREPEPAVSGLALTVDGAAAGLRPWVFAVTPDAPHVLEASAPDGRAWRARVQGRSGERLSLTVVLARAEDRPAVATTPSPSSGALRIGGVVVGAAGLAALATGTVFGVLASGARGDLADAVDRDPSCVGSYPDARCDAAARGRLGPLEDRAYTQSTIATVSLVAGGVLLVGGVVMWALAPRATRSTNQAAGLVASGLLGGGRGVPGVPGVPGVRVVLGVNGLGGVF